jgi:hypothetical protein
MFPAWPSKLNRKEQKLKLLNVQKRVQNKVVECVWLANQLVTGLYSDGLLC